MNFNGNDNNEFLDLRIYYIDSKGAISVNNIAEIDCEKKIIATYMSTGTTGSIKRFGTFAYTPKENLPIYTDSVTFNVDYSNFLTWEITDEVAEIANNRIMKWKEEKQNELLKNIDTFNKCTSHANEIITNIKELKGKTANN